MLPPEAEILQVIISPWDLLYQEPFLMLPPVVVPLYKFPPMEEVRVTDRVAEPLDA